MQIIGGGETSASVVVALINFFADKGLDNRVSIDNRRATVYSRGEGYHENKYFTNPDGWENLTFDLRREFIQRTDRGVFSIHTINLIDNCEFVNSVFGTVTGVAQLTAGKLTINLETKNHGKEPALQRLDYDCVINALGFDNLAFLDMMGDSFFDAIQCTREDLFNDRDLLSTSIDYHLKLNKLEKPKLNAFGLDARSWFS